MSKDNPEIYTYEMKKSWRPNILVKGVAIRPSWVQRMKNYTSEHGYKVLDIVRFIERGLKGKAGEEGYVEKCLDSELTTAQKWVLLNIYLGEEVPEIIRDVENDENAPKMVATLFPDIERESRISKVMKKIPNPLSRSQPDVVEPDAGDEAAEDGE